MLGHGRLADKASDIESVGKHVAEHGGFGTVGQAKPRRAFEVMAGLIGIAAFSIALAPLAQRPAGRIHFEVTGQADVSVGECQTDADEVAQVLIRLTIGTCA